MNRARADHDDQPRVAAGQYRGHLGPGGFDPCLHGVGHRQFVQQQRRIGEDETARDVDGLALSSRNGYLTKQERAIAPFIHATLQELREAVACGFDNYVDLEKHAREKLKSVGFEPDYVSVRDARTLKEVNPYTEQIVILAAAKLGKTRLIDNVSITLDPGADWGMLATH